MEILGKNKVRNGLLLALGAFLLLASSMSPVFAAPAATPPPLTVHAKGIWSLPVFSATTLNTTADWQYAASYGSGNFTCTIKGNYSNAALLLQINTVTSVVTFTGQIFCQCKIHGRSGDLWISLTNGVDVNFSNPNGATTGDLTIINSNGGLAGATGHGTFVTTSSSDLMNYTMTIRLA